MPIVSYAQNFEDVLLWRALGHVDRGFYVDIGAQDPVLDSVSKAFYDRGWRGVNVDASTHYADSLRKARPDEIVVQAAISDQPGMLKFYEIPSTGLSTASDETAKSHRKAGWRVVETLVPAVILDQVFAKLDTGEIHWLKIDVEGLERAVLEGWRTSTYRPWVVVVESTYPSTQITTHNEWEHLILEKDYRFVHFDGLNRYYLSAAHSELRDFFGYGPSVWDEFQLPESSRQVSALVQRQNEVLGRAHAEAAANDARQAETIAQAQTSIVQLRTELAASSELGERLQAELAASSELGERLQAELAASSELGERLQAELAASSELGERLQAELAASSELGERLQAELAASSELGDALAVDAKRARAEAATALRREEAAEANMAALELDLLRRDAEIACIRTRLSDVEAWLEAVRRSTSWRVTRPYRVIGRLVQDWLKVRRKTKQSFVA